MRKRHKDISLLLKIIAREVMKMEVVDEENEERLERMRRKVLQWKTKQIFTNMVMELT